MNSTPSTLHLAGSTLAFDGGLEVLPAPLRRRMRPWRSRRSPELSIQVRDAPPLLPAWPPRWESHGPRRLVRSRDFVYDLDLATGRCLLWLEDRNDEGVWDQVLRNLAYHLTLAAGGLLLHGAAMDLGDGVVLLLGPSGVGKTTTVRKYRPPVLFSDEFVFLRPHGRTFRLHPCPPWDHLQWGLRSRSPRTLAAIYCLAQSRRSTFRRLDPAEAMARLLHRPAAEDLDEASLGRHLEGLERLLRGTPCWEARLSRYGRPRLPHMTEKRPMTGDRPMIEDRP